MSYQIAVRLKPALYNRLRKATNRDRDWQAPTISALVQRGLELALKELESRQKTERTK